MLLEEEKARQSPLVNTAISPLRDPFTSQFQLLIGLSTAVAISTKYWIVRLLISGSADASVYTRVFSTAYSLT